MVEVVREALDYVQQLEALGVLRGDPAKAQPRPQDVAAHRAGGVRVTVVVHGRYLVLDGSEGYHIGASLKDAGKKAFGINRLEDPSIVEAILERL